MSDFNLFAPRNIGSALSVGGLAALMIAGPLRPDILALSSTCLLGSLAAFATHACFGGRRPRIAKVAKSAQPRPVQPMAVAAEWEDAESWEIPPTRDARQAWDAARALDANRPLPPGRVPPNVHRALLMPVQAVAGHSSGPTRPSETTEAPREHRSALADMRGRRTAQGAH